MNYLQRYQLQNDWIIEKSQKNCDSTWTFTPLWNPKLQTVCDLSNIYAPIFSFFKNIKSFMFFRITIRHVKYHNFLCNLQICWANFLSNCRMFKMHLCCRDPKLSSMVPKLTFPFCWISCLSGLDYHFWCRYTGCL